MTSSVTDSSLSVVGRVLDGRYRVLSHLADGGMATVYLALDQRLDREVAVKVMHDNLARDATFVSRFRREARSAARLSHPHVVAVYDQGEDDSTGSTTMFLAMEYVPGRTLRDVLTAEGPLTPRAALDLFDPILQAIAAAHDAGLIHRDVKPENVILREDGVVKVADFGLARAVTAATTTNASGTLLGTVAYLSPEQVERGIADARSDVYAAGLVLYEMLTGRKAFDGDSRSTWRTSTFTARCRCPRHRSRPFRRSSTSSSRWPPPATPTSGRPTRATTSPRSGAHGR